MCGAGHAEAVAHDHRAPGNRRLPDGRHRAHALLDRARSLGVEADEEPRAVDQIDHRQMERLREVHEALDLLTGVGRPGAAVEVRIAGHERHRPAVQPCEGRDDRATVERRDLEERVAVDDGLDDRAHLVRLADVTRDGVHQPLRTPGGIIGRRPTRWQLVDRRRQIRQEPPCASKGLRLRVDGVVDGARLQLDLPAAELVLAELLSQPLHDRRTGDEERG